MHKTDHHISEVLIFAFLAITCIVVSPALAEIPVAGFTSDVQTGSAPLIVTFTDQSTDIPTSWLWDFGDGDVTNATEQNPVHTYVSAGTYTINLTATNADGSDSEEKPGYISVSSPGNPLVADFLANATSGYAPLTVNFTDNSTGDGITGYQWILSDDPGMVFDTPGLLHTFTTPGTYDVAHAAMNATGTSWKNVTGYITVSEMPAAPVVNFTADPQTGNVPFIGTFNDTSYGDGITGYQWILGDNPGTVYTEQNFTHIFTTAGSYSVNHSATNAGGTSWKNESDYIIANPHVSRTWTVGSVGCDFATLADAFASAFVVDGDTVFVYNGTYSFTGMTKSITLTGESADLVTLDLGGTTTYRTISGTGTVIEKVRFTKGRISTSGSSNMIIRNCIIEAMTYPSGTSGAFAVAGTNNTISGNIFRNNAVACTILASGSGNRIEGNTLSYQTSTYAGRSVIRFSSTAPTNLVIRNNTFFENAAPCFYISGSGSGNSIYLNNFIIPSGTNPIYGSGSGVAVSWVTPGPVDYTYNGSSYNAVLGNYWTTYTGTDADGNGIGDTPYSLGVTNQVDNAPLMTRWQYLFGGSQALTTIDVIPSSLYIHVGETRQFTATAYDELGIPISGVSFTWASTNETAGSVNQTGFFTPLADGTTSVTATNNTVTGSAAVQVTGTPLTDFYANQTFGMPPLAVQFTDTSTNTPTTWAWDFQNDGTVDSTDQNPVFIFTSGGQFSVNLTATNDWGSNSTLKTTYIVVPRTWTVGASGCDFTTISAAVNSPSVIDRDILYIYNGTYSEGNLIFSKELTMVGEGTDVTTIDMASGQWRDDKALRLEKLRFLMINLQMPGSGSSFRNCLVDSVSGGAQGMVVHASDFVYENNVVTYAATTGSYPLRFGLTSRTSNITVRNNSFSNVAGMALYLAQVTNATVENNTFRNVGEYAVNFGGIGSGVQNCTVRYNTFEGNVADFMFRSNSNCVVYLNNFIGNTPRVIYSSPSGTHTFNSTTPLPYTWNGEGRTAIVGNYWSAYTGTDADGNGIGDTLYQVNPSAAPSDQDNAPLLDRFQFFFGATHTLALINVTPAPLTINTTETRQFAASAKDTEGLSIPGLNYTWASSNTTVGTINTTGFFSALVVGNTTVSATNGTVTGTSEVTVLLQPPAASFTANPTTGTPPLTVAFNDTSTGDTITEYQWILGDDPATVYTDQNLTHVFASSGTYSVNHSAMNAAGTSWLNQTDFITVSMFPAPTVSSLTPNSGVNTTTIRITNLAGTNFLLNPFVTQTVKLNGTGYADIVATNVNRISSTQLNCTFDLAGQPAGMRNVVVTNPDGQEAMLVDGFTITSPVATRHQAVFRHMMGHNWIFTDTLTGVKYRDHYGIPDDVPLVGDFNNDGVMDRGVYRNGQWIVDRNMDGTVDARSNYGVPTDVPLVGDFNNDGVMDRAVFRSGSWIVDRNMDGTVDSRTHYGVAGDIPLVGDFDNDGITDRAVFRNGQWIVDLDMDGDVDSRVNYGVATDIPLVGFFDDDAFMDRAVFRNGQWIIDSGFDGSINSRPRFGAAGDIPLAWVTA